jgi:hypothetical protein
VEEGRRNDDIALAVGLGGFGEAENKQVELSHDK